MARYIVLRADFDREGAKADDMAMRGLADVSAKVRITPTADVEPKSELHDDHHKQVACYTLGCREGDKIRREVAREIFEEIEKHRDKMLGIAVLFPEKLAELKKKYTEGE